MKERQKIYRKKNHKSRESPTAQPALEILPHTHSRNTLINTARTSGEKVRDWFRRSLTQYSCARRCRPEQPHISHRRAASHKPLYFKLIRTHTVTRILYVAEFIKSALLMT